MAADFCEPQRRRLVRLCAAVSGDHQAAEDLAQETLLEAWRNAHKLHDPAGVDRWLAAIARNVCRRWARRRGREAIPAELGAAPSEDDQGLEHAEIVELLDRALTTLPPETRQVLVDRYVDDLPHAEIAGRAGVSEAAVAMRLSRGRAVLRQLLTAEGVGDADHDAWKETRVWCIGCGGRRLLIRREPDLVSFRCPGCSRDSAPSGQLSLTNPSFAQLVGELVRPSSMLNRLAAWSHRYYSEGAGADVPCTRCGRPVRLRTYRREAGKDSRGLFARCSGCAEAVSTSLSALGLAQPEGRRFLREHGRVRALPERKVEHQGQRALVLRYEHAMGSASLDVVFARDTGRVLAAR